MFVYFQFKLGIYVYVYSIFLLRLCIFYILSLFTTTTDLDVKRVPYCFAYEWILSRVSCACFFEALHKNIETLCTNTKTCMATPQYRKHMRRRLCLIRPNSANLQPYFSTNHATLVCNP